MVTLTPPHLPSYLADINALRPIIGTPKEDEVKGIQAVIRALNSVSHLPSLHDPHLSMQLSQHLFDAQMAVHQSHYSASPLPQVYIPPQPCLQTSLVHSTEYLSNNPRLFDPDLSMRLSQHMFNLDPTPGVFNARDVWHWL
ncbi:hypothetical protein OPQ81_008612 [Rhizoctonia solani]|nr:hypothetical protein OPQ81_008612 [Rhizoctonia solani]